MKKKECKKCHRVRNIDQFYTHKPMRDGHLSFCKECVCSRMARKWRENVEVNRAKERERGRKRRKQPGYKEKRSEYSRAYFKKYPKRYIAKMRVKKLYKKRPYSCELCGTSGKIQGHHNDYRKPLIVVWVCPPCHSKIHKPF